MKSDGLAAKRGAGEGDPAALLEGMDMPVAFPLDRRRVEAGAAGELRKDCRSGLAPAKRLRRSGRQASAWGPLP